MFNRIKRYWRYLVLATLSLIVALAVILMMPPSLTIAANDNYLNITVSGGEPMLLSDIPILGANGYAVLEPSGCYVEDGKISLRIDMFLDPSDANYYREHVYVIDETSKEYQAGYKGKLDKDEQPVDFADYDKWLNGLPHIWRDNPFHSHFINVDANTSDAEIKQKIEDTLDYFYSFYTACWNQGKEFIEEWKKVPRSVGTIREPFVRGDESKSSQLTARLDNIKSKLPDYNLSKNVAGDFQLPEGHQTIDIGDAATNRGNSFDLRSSGVSYMAVETDNPANATGTLDTVQIYLAYKYGTLSQYVGTFSISGTTLTCRDSTNLGNVTAGSTQTFTGKSISVVIGDYIGTTSKTGTYDQLSYGYGTAGVGKGMWSCTGEYVDPSDSATYSYTDRYLLSLYATGTEAASFDISNVPSSENLGTVGSSSTYYAFGSAPSNPVSDNQCTFTITNSGSTCDLDMKISDFTGGTTWNIVSGSPSSNEVRVTAYYSGQNPASGLILANTDAEFYDGLAAGTKKWDFKFETGTLANESNQHSATLTITAVAED